PAAAGHRREPARGGPVDPGGCVRAGQYVTDTLPDPSVTVITWPGAVVLSTLTVRLPESVVALTWERTPRGSTTFTLPVELLTLTRVGALLNVRSTFPEPSVTTTSRLSRLSKAMSPEPALSVTLGPDSAPPVMFPDPVWRLTLPVSTFACTSPDPDPTVTGPV